CPAIFPVSTNTETPACWQPARQTLPKPAPPYGQGSLGRDTPSLAFPHPHPTPNPYGAEPDQRAERSGLPYEHKFRNSSILAARQANTTAAHRHAKTRTPTRLPHSQR